MIKKILAVLMVLILTTIATASAETMNKNQNADEQGIQEQLGVEVSPGVFYLGTSTHNGMLVEGYSFVHYAKDRESMAEAKAVADENVDIYKFMFGGIKWSETMQYEVNTIGSDLDDDKVRDVLSASLETWDTETSFELFNDTLPTTTDGFNSGDGINRVTWDDLGSSGTIAMNSFWFNPATKEMIESDVRFNTHYEWSIAEEPDGEVMDLQNIATHEFGHNGLNDLYMSSSKALTMHGVTYSWGDTQKRDLGVGDILGIQALYGL